MELPVFTSEQRTGTALNARHSNGRKGATNEATKAREREELPD
jgi:hypothetical protein